MRVSFGARAAAFLLATALAAPAPVFAATAPVPSVPVPLMRETIKTLASDELEGRAPSGPKEQAVLDAIITRFKAAGLKPGNKGQWLQPVPMVTIAAKNISPLTVGSLSFKPGADFVVGSYREADHTAIDASELVFVGYGITAPELGWDDYAGVDMKGKIAVILVNDPDYENADEQGLFKGRRMTWYGRWPYKYAEAARHGAKAALIVHDTFPAAYGWNVLESSGGTGNFVASANKGMDQTEANGWIRRPVAEAIFQAAGKDFAALSTAAKQKGFHAVPLGATASLSFNNTVTHSTSHNVIGVIPGTSRANEYVLYSGHWDHLGHCKPDATGDDICNGAIDNASGVGALVALAQMNRRAGPTPRTQVFAAWTLEESGLLGSEYYAQHPVYPLARTVGGVNMDALSLIGPTRDVQVTGGDKSDLTAILRQVESQMHLTETPEDHPERGHYYRSDHFSLAKRGVPMFAVGRGTDLVNGGTKAGEAATEDYVEHHYHQPSDEYSDSWDMTGMAQEVELYYRLGRALATGTTWPNWHQGDEFRAIRDASRATVTQGK
ncbi:M28 family metallopeptidase [Novosphingobium sp. SG720]|uniref:M28 family metallopeptidase n=1 Tax=Novosphingobium sp. SG720 TaxID=2586998 RepID=UPI001445F522|nr:M28 family metallopeptidase [Novosphingobium sp. SG720]NKJ42931.1 Zn-dependent M28 family amino/carboxypeptidase [Novosphingobium sp. SG720]